MVNDSGGRNVPQELQTFLPQEGANGVSKYKIAPTKDAEVAVAGEFDPFKERKNEHPTTNQETLVHLLKASLGTGILAMPVAFSYSGTVVGIFATIFTAFICTHCAYILVKCAHKLYVRTRRTKMNFAEVAEIACLNGPKWCKPFAKIAKISILLSLFITYFGTCSVYTVIIADNLRQVVEHYLQQQINIRIIIASCLIPLILLSWIPNLKYLAPVSMIANFFMAVGLGITFYYIVDELPSVSSKPMANALSELPKFFSITIFAMEAIGVVMPLENAMKTPRSFIGVCGVLNQGMSGVTLIYMLLGFLGYVRYGDKALGSVTLNLDITLIPAQVVKILIALAVYCTFGLQFYVCLEIGWNAIKEKFIRRPTLVNYVMRTVLVAGAVLLAVAVPTISPFIGLIGAFCFSILGLIFPVFIEIITYWNDGFGKYSWIIIKNVLIVAFGIFALVFGSISAIEEIIGLYTKKDEN